MLVVPTVIAVVALAILLGRQLEDKLRQDALDSAERSGQVFASLMFDADEFEDGRLQRAPTPSATCARPSGPTTRSWRSGCTARPTG